MAIISAATTTSHATPRPMRSPVMIWGQGSGKDDQAKELEISDSKVLERLGYTAARWCERRLLSAPLWGRRTRKIKKMGRCLRLRTTGWPGGSTRWGRSAGGAGGGD